jgi:hypothetical protein
MVVIEQNLNFDTQDALDGQCHLKVLFETIANDNERRKSLKGYLEKSRLNGHYDLTHDELETWEPRVLTIAILIAREDIYPPIEDDCIEKQIKLLKQFNDRPIHTEKISILESNDDVQIFKICCGDQSGFKKNRLKILDLEQFFEISENTISTDDTSQQSL